MKKRYALIICGIILSLCGCGTESDKEVGLQTETIPAVESVDTGDSLNHSDESAENSATAEDSIISEDSTTAENSTTKREDGERFEGTIMLEGDEVPVYYEHAVNDAIGIEIDFDYDSLERHSESDKESFISVYDDVNAPDNYLEVTYMPENTDAVIASISDKLSKEYEISVEPFELENAGSCTRIDASASVGGTDMPNKLQMVYIIPAKDGTVVGTSHYSIEAAEGFGHLFNDMMHTLLIK